LKVRNLLIFGYVFCTLYYSNRRVLINFDKVDYMEEVADPDNATLKKTRIIFSKENQDKYIEVREPIWKIGEQI
jgi:hypothetical protein